MIYYDLLLEYWNIGYIILWLEYWIYYDIIVYHYDLFNSAPFFEDKMFVFKKGYWIVFFGKAAGNQQDFPIRYI